MWKDEIRKSNRDDLDFLVRLEAKLEHARRYFVTLIDRRDANKNTIEKQVLMDALGSLDKCMEIISEHIQETSLQPDF